MALNCEGVDINKYRCAKCGRVPQKANDLFTGCSCGHRLFRLQLNANNTPQQSNHMKNNSKQKDMGFLTIREEKVGIYQINVDKLMQKGKKEEDSPVVAGNDGVYSIRLEKLNKKTHIQR